MKSLLRTSCLIMVLPVMFGILSSAYAKESQPVKIGLVTSLTGPYSPWGIPGSLVYQWVVDQVNKGGGIKSMGGAKVELIVSDCESDAKKCATEVERMLTLRNPQVMLSPISSPLTKISMPICQRHKVSVIGPDNADELFKMGNPYWFGVCAKASTLAIGLSDLIAKIGKDTGNPAKRAAVLCWEGSYGETISDTFVKYLPTKGIEVVANQIYPSGKVADFSDTIAKFKALNADVLFAAGTPAEDVMITRSMKAVDFNPLGFVFSGTGIDTPDYLNLGKDANFAFGSPVFPIGEIAPKIKGAAAALEKFYADTGEKGKKMCSPMWTLQLMLSIGPIIHAFEKGGSYDPAVLRDTIAKLELRTGDRFIYWPDGVRFDETGFNYMCKTIGGQYQNLKIKVLYPESLVSAGDKAVWPIPKWRER